MKASAAAARHAGLQKRSHSRAQKVFHFPASLHAGKAPNVHYVQLCGSSFLRFGVSFSGFFLNGKLIHKPAQRKLRDIQTEGEKNIGESRRTTPLQSVPVQFIFFMATQNLPGNLGGIYVGRNWRDLALLTSRTCVVWILKRKSTFSCWMKVAFTFLAICTTGIVVPTVFTIFSCWWSFNLYVISGY